MLALENVISSEAGGESTREIELADKAKEVIRFDVFGSHGQRTI